MKRLLLAGTLLFNVPVFAQESMAVDPISTDRPGDGTGSSVVGKGFLQLETGMQFERFDFGVVESNVTTFNTSLLRYGLLDKVELRLGWDFEQIRDEVDGKPFNDLQSGYTPLLVGFKAGIIEEKGWIPEVAVLGHLFLPSAAGNDFKPETTGGELLLAFTNTLNDRSNLGYTLGANWADDEAAITYSYAFAYNYSLTDRLGAFAEAYGRLPENNAGQNSWDAGLTYLITNDLLIDASLGSGFDTDQCIFLSGGLSYRLR